MKRYNILRLILAAMLLAAPARAHHVVFLDSSQFTLSAYPTVNGHTPPTANDLAQVRAQIIANMVKDYAPFDIHFLTVQPASGRFTRVAFFSASNGTVFGCAGDSCCAFGNCTGIGSFVNSQSGCEIYAGTFASDPAFSGANATTARIANGISHTASHELGHVLGLRHCHAADDFVSSGAACFDGFAATTDANVNFHMMASGTSSGLTMSQRATRDRFFSIHSERRALYKSFQPLNHWSLLGDVAGAVRGSDLTIGHISSPDIVQWSVSLSSGGGFGSASQFASDAGTSQAMFFLADVNGDGRADLVIGEAISASIIRWRARLSTGSSFAAATVFANDAGDAGNIFRMADINGDGRKDLLRGVVDSPTNAVRWLVHFSSGNAFGPAQTVSNGAGNEGDLFSVGLVTGRDSRDDLVVVHRGAQGFAQIFRSTGTSLVLETPFPTIFSNFNPDYVLLGDVLFNDGAADLVVGTVLSDTQVAWDVAALDEEGCLIPPATRVPCFSSLVRVANDIGDAGDFFRLGDLNGDGRIDLVDGRWAGMTSRTNTPNLTLINWFGQLSTGGGFGPTVTFANDLGDEGDLFP